MTIVVQLNQFGGEFCGLCFGQIFFGVYFSQKRVLIFKNVVHDIDFFCVCENDCSCSRIRVIQ
jgi:hypothetical protein